MKFFSATVDPMAAAWQPEHLSRVGTPAKVPSARNAWQSSHLAAALSAWTWWLKSTGCACGMAAGGFVQGGNAGEGAVGAKRVAVVALGRGLVGVDLVAEIDRLRVRLVNHARKAGPARSQGRQHSDCEYSGSAKCHGLALSARIGREKCMEQRQHLV